MKYIRIEDGTIIDIDSFIKTAKENTYYCEYIFEEPKNENDVGVLRWTAVGAKSDLHDNQYCRRCQFGVEFNGKIIKQADNIEELFDEYVWMRRIIYKEDVERIKKNGSDYPVYGSIWVDDNLIKVAKMKGVLPNGEIDWEVL